jgi:hypothetical protein
MSFLSATGNTGKKLKKLKKRPITLEDIINSEDVLTTIATKIASSAEQKVSVEEIKQTIKEYIPYIKKIADAYPEDPSFYDKIMRIPGIPDVERDIKPLNPKLYMAIEELAEKLKEDLREEEKVAEHKDERKTSPPLDPNVKVEVLSILNGLEFAGFSEEAKRKAIERLSARIREVSVEKPTPENLLKLGLYAYAVELIRRGEFEKVEGLKKLQN